MINFYHDMWRWRSHTLAPLTALVSKQAKWRWGKEQQKAFDDMKKTIGKETLLNFPDLNKTFHIYTDTSDYQLSAVIMQDNKLLAFYSRKMNSAQKKYTTGEQELLSIVETLKEFRNILLGQDLVVHTDHKNIVHGDLTNTRIAQWQLLLKEFGPKYVHIAGKDNVVTDALSHMEANFEEANATLKQEVWSQVCAYTLSHMIPDEGMLMPDANDQFEMAYAFRETNKDDEVFPLHPELIAQEQKKDRTYKPISYHL